MDKINVVVAKIYREKVKVRQKEYEEGLGEICMLFFMFRAFIYSNKNEKITCFSSNTSVIRKIF